MNWYAKAIDELADINLLHDGQTVLREFAKRYPKHFVEACNNAVKERKASRSKSK